MKGGYKSLINFLLLIKTKFIEPGETIYFKGKNSKKEFVKIPLTIHKEGIIQYNNHFFSDNKGDFILPIIDDKLSLLTLQVG